MGLGPSGSLPYRYYRIVLPYILAINSVCVCVGIVYLVVCTVQDFAAFQYVI